MGTVGDSFDNALRENFFSTLEDRTGLPDRLGHPGAGRERLFAYIDGWYNTRRSQRRLGYHSPAEYGALIETENINLTPTGAS